MRNGFTIEWKTKKKDETKKSFTSESYNEVDKKWSELKSKGYKVSNIMQCIF